MAKRDSAKDLRASGWDWASKKAEANEHEKAAGVEVEDLGLVRKLR